jgi:hypothetical protein
MDISNALYYVKSNNVIALAYLKAMNKKFAFTVGQNEPRKMDPIMASKISDVMIVGVNF